MAHFTWKNYIYCTNCDKIYHKNTTEIITIGDDIWYFCPLCRTDENVVFPSTHKHNKMLNKMREYRLRFKKLKRILKK